MLERGDTQGSNPRQCQGAPLSDPGRKLVPGSLAERAVFANPSLANSLFYRENTGRNRLVRHKIGQTARDF
jgi:hypothetical protein